MNSVELRMPAVSRLFEKAPAVAYYWMRAHLRNNLFTHRREWLASKSTKFGRGGGGVKVLQVSDGEPSTVASKDVAYSVAPAARRMPPAAASQGLAQLRAQAFTGSEVLRVHQEGAIIRKKSKLLAVPVRTRPATPAAWKRRNPGKKLVLGFSNGKPRLVEKSKTKRGKVKLRTRFLLVPSVKMDETLRFYESWDSLQQQRDNDFAKVSDRILKDIADGLTS